MLAHQSEVGDRQHARTVVVAAEVAIAVAEGVELLDVAELEPGLLAHPAAQAELERAVAFGVEAAERQRRLAGGAAGRLRPRVRRP